MNVRKPKRLSRQVVYENPWVNLYIDRVQFPGGRIIDQHHLLDFEQEAVTALVEDAEGRILMVHAYRYTTGAQQWELPAGGVDKGETISQAAQREVLEESGYQTSDCELFYTYYPMNGIANKVFHIVRCQARVKIGDHDCNEISEIRWFTPQEIREMIHTGRLLDGSSLTALLLHFQ